MWNISQLWELHLPPSNVFIKAAIRVYIHYIGGKWTVSTRSALVVVAWMRHDGEGEMTLSGACEQPTRRRRRSQCRVSLAGRQTTNRPLITESGRVIRAAASGNKLSPRFPHIVTAASTRYQLISSRPSVQLILPLDCCPQSRIQLHSSSTFRPPPWTPMPQTAARNVQTL